MGFQVLTRPTPAEPLNAWRAGAATVYAAAQAAPGVIVKAAPTGAGQSLYVTDIVISSDTAGWVQVVYDATGAGTALGSRIWVPVTGGAGLNFTTRLMAPVGKNVGVITAIAGNHSCLLCGYTA